MDSVEGRANLCISSSPAAPLCLLACARLIFRTAYFPEDMHCPAEWREPCLLGGTRLGEASTSAAFFFSNFSLLLWPPWHMCSKPWAQANWRFVVCSPLGGTISNQGEKSFSQGANLSVDF